MELWTCAVIIYEIRPIPLYKGANYDNPLVASFCIHQNEKQTLSLHCMTYTLRVITTNTSASNRVTGLGIVVVVLLDILFPSISI